MTDNQKLPQRPDGPRRVPFWEWGNRHDMGDTLSDVVRSIMDDEAIMRPVALYALGAGLTARALDREPAGFEWSAKGADVLSALESLGGKLFLVDGGNHYLAWPDGIARVGISSTTGNVWTLALASCNEWLLATVRADRKKWLRPAEPVAPTTTVLVLTKSSRDFGTTAIAQETSNFVEGNYAASTVEAYRRALEALRSKTPPGRLLVLEGKTGTGKTHMVRALLSALQGTATVLPVPEHLVANLAEPAIVPVLVNLSLQRKPIVLVLEDCDDCLLSREHTTAQGDRANVATLSAVLNLADGILGAALNLRLVATTNARVDHMDTALLRPGRLIERIEVGPLPFDRAAEVVVRETGMGLGTVTEALDILSAGGTLTLAEAYAIARHILADRAAQTPAATETITNGHDTTADTTAQA